MYARTRVFMRDHVRKRYFIHIFAINGGIFYNVMKEKYGRD